MTTGKGARNLILLAVAIAVVALVMIYRSWQPEPVYRGHRLSYWLQAYSRGPYTPPINYTDADAALKTAGTNAIPTLLRLLAAKDPAWKRRLMALGVKNYFFRTLQTRWLHLTSSLHYNAEAVEGFSRLGSEAQKSIPVAAWISVYNQSPSYLSQHFAIKSVGDLGPAAKSAVTNLLRIAANTNANPVMRVEAIEALARIHAPPESVTPVLMQAAHDPNRIVREAALDYLGPFSADPKSAVAALVKALSDPDANVRKAALFLLEMLDPDWLTEADQYTLPANK